MFLWPKHYPVNSDVIVKVKAKFILPVLYTVADFIQYVDLYSSLDYLKIFKNIYSVQ